MTFNEFASAVEDARIIEKRANSAVNSLAGMCVGRLRNANVSSYVLRALKRELRDFNMTTGIWSD